MASDTPISSSAPFTILSICMEYVLPFAAFEIWYTTFSSWQGEDFTWQSEVPFHIPSILVLPVCWALQFIAFVIATSIRSLQRIGVLLMFLIAQKINNY